MMTLSCAPFIVGAPRSGTTLLRMMLDSHPEFAIPPETGFVPEVLQKMTGNSVSWKALFELITEYETWTDFHLPEESLACRLQQIEPFNVADGLRNFYQLYAERFGKPRWGDKTPNYGLHMQEIQDTLPEVRFLHLIRDGRDVAASIRGLWFAPSSDWGELGADWSWRVAAFRSQGQHCRFYMEIRYEELVKDTEAVLKRICSFLGVPFDSRMTEYYRFAPARLQEHESRVRRDGSVVISKESRQTMQYRTTTPPDPSRCGAWKNLLTPEQLERFMHAAGPLLRELKYV
jgi:sulfotransferase family protein